jgi:hypothetical protein
MESSLLEGMGSDTVSSCSCGSESWYFRREETYSGALRSVADGTESCVVDDSLELEFERVNMERGLPEELKPVGEI